MISFKVKNLPSINFDWWTPTQKEWAPILLEQQKPFWKDEKNPTTGRPWEKLKPGYQAWKDRNYPGQPILRRTGVMESTARIVPKNDGFAASVVSYGIYQQFGTKHMPARPWLGIPPASLATLGVIAFKNIFFSNRRKK